MLARQSPLGAAESIHFLINRPRSRIHTALNRLLAWRVQTVHGALREQRPLSTTQPSNRLVHSTQNTTLARLPDIGSNSISLSTLLCLIEFVWPDRANGVVAKVSTANPAHLETKQLLKPGLMSLNQCCCQLVSDPWAIDYIGNTYITS